MWEWGEFKQDSAWHVLLVWAKTTGATGIFSGPWAGTIKKEHIHFYECGSERKHTNSTQVLYLPVFCAWREMHPSANEPSQKLSAAVVVSTAEGHSSSLSSQLTFLSQKKEWSSQSIMVGGSAWTLLIAVPLLPDVLVHLFLTRFEMKYIKLGRTQRTTLRFPSQAAFRKNSFQSRSGISLAVNLQGWAGKKLRRFLRSTKT